MNDIHTPHYISPDQLCTGLYVHLDLGWMDHPFTFNNFKIKNEEQIRQIRALKLGKIRYDPLRSDCEPAPLIPDTEESTPLTATAEPQQPEMPEQTQQQHFAERLQKLHEAIYACEKEFAAAANTVRQVTNQLPTQPKTARETAEALVNKMVDSVLTESDVVLHAISGNNYTEENYVHALNVTVLALMLAKSLDMTMEDARALGMATIFHDVGKTEIPGKILKKTDPLTKAEQSFLEQHCELGARIVRESGMSEHIANIIYQHHEFVDGTGYPKHLKEAQIDPLARLVCIVNTYDNLCNPVNPASAMTPYEALAHMFASQRQKFDSAILKLLIKSLGVYPPGSIVMLSNNVHGIVMSVNPSKPLRPFVMIHAPEVPRETPIVLDLSEEITLNIHKCLRIAQLPKDVFDYLNPRKRISYYFDKDKPANDKQ